MRFSQLVLTLVIISSFSYQLPQQNKILMLIDNVAVQTTHSIFINDLIEKGYNVDIKMINSLSTKLQEYGEFLYDHIIVFCTSEAEPKVVLGKHILEFFDAGGNVLIAGDIDTSKLYRTVLNNFGVEMDLIGSQVYDDFNHLDPLTHTLITTKNVVPGKPFFEEKITNPIIYQGVGLTLTKYENFQVYTVLEASEDAYSFKPDLQIKNLESQILNAGHAIVLTAAIQGRNNARAVITGSLEMFSNNVFKRKNFDNQKFVSQLINWNFQKTGVLRLGKVHHNLKGQHEQPFEYKVKDFLEYYLEIEQYDSSKNQWVPYITDDLILEFVMLDPYVRTPLIKEVAQGEKQNNRYFVHFQVYNAPDKYGVFQFKVVYQKPGYTFIKTSTKVPVRPLKHNEYERYLWRAYPYYIGVFGTIFIFVIFLYYFLLDSSEIKTNIKK